MLDRAALVSGQAFDGPAVVEQLDSTTLIPPASGAESTDGDDA